jgi:hypothetical protein
MKASAIGTRTAEEEGGGGTGSDVEAGDETEGVVDGREEGGCEGVVLFTGRRGLSNNTNRKIKIKPKKKNSPTESENANIVHSKSRLCPRVGNILGRKGSHSVEETASDCHVDDEVEAFIPGLSVRRVRVSTSSFPLTSGRRNNSS